MLSYVGTAISQAGATGWEVAFICFIIVVRGLQTDKTKESVAIAIAFYGLAMVLQVAIGLGAI